MLKVICLQKMSDFESYLFYARVELEINKTLEFFWLQAIWATFTKKNSQFEKHNFC